MKSVMSIFVVVLTLSISPAMAEKSAGESVDDTWLHTKVKTALVGHGSSGINVEVYHGVVQLAGFLTDETNKEAAVLAAKGVEGVKRVSDQLFVVEPGRSAGQTLDDNVLTGKVKSALADGDFDRGFDTNVEVNRGVVLLSGFATNAEDPAEAVKITQGIKGVKKVLMGIDAKPASD